MLCRPDQGQGASFPSLLSSIELSDITISEPSMRALLGTAPHFCRVVVLNLKTILLGTALHYSQIKHFGNDLCQRNLLHNSVVFVMFKCLDCKFHWREIIFVRYREAISRSADQIKGKDPPCDLHPEPYTLHPESFTLHPEPYNLHPESFTLHPEPYTLHPEPYTLHSAPYSLLPTPYSLHPAPYTLPYNPNNRP